MSIEASIRNYFWTVAPMIDTSTWPLTHYFISGQHVCEFNHFLSVKHSCALLSSVRVLLSSFRFRITAIYRPCRTGSAIFNCTLQTQQQLIFTGTVLSDVCEESLGNSTRISNSLKIRLLEVDCLVTVTSHHLHDIPTEQAVMLGDKDKDRF